jgi:aspartyl-tRNA synthetase
LFFARAAPGGAPPRPEGTVNPKLPTGEIEVRASALEVLNRSEPPPFETGSSDLPGEEVRLKYRYLDLRRPAMQQTMILRHRVAKLMRDYFDGLGFLEIETPMLARSMPEGARDYLVPSRIQHGSFYALPQSPQLFKQILMVAGFDRYVQIVRCFRDEDLRADRQPEFTQLDLEMSFVEAGDVIDVIDGLAAFLVKELRGQELKLPLSRMTYREAMERYGTDRPDRRFGMEIADVTELAGRCEFKVFRTTAESGGKVRGLCAKGAADRYSRKGLDELTAFAQSQGAKGLVWFKVEAEGLASPVAKLLTAEEQAELRTLLEAEPGDLLLFVADTFETTCRALGALRSRLGKELALYAAGAMDFSWIVEFPLLMFDEEEKRWVAEHHPFTMPLPEDQALLTTNPAAVRAQAYDIIINGYEAGGGTIRNHDPALQQQVFDLLGIDPQQAAERFGFLMDALRFGAPPHGGIALGLDRWVMLFAGLSNIRDVIAFPKTQRATDLMTGAPSAVEPRQLRELGISVSR